MLARSCLLTALVGLAMSIGTPPAAAGDLKITIPRSGKLTPVQRLNREGVDAVRKHNYAKAGELFYKAYLFDPDDPFTLNNLGYISELQGQIDRAQEFYELAAEEPSDAMVDRSSSPKVEGRPVREVLSAADQPLQLNHANVEAVRLLSEGRAPEADLLLQEVLKTNTSDVFTLNNLGVAKEMEGEELAALNYYDEAAAQHSDATAVVTANRVWRGRPVSDMAAESAKTLRARLRRANELAEQVRELNLRGVSAVNRNDLRSATEDFRRAYALEGNNAFTLNNIGYVSELEGDPETAQFFYERAREANGADTTVGVATRRSAEGAILALVAADNNAKVETKFAHERKALQSERGPVALRRRDNSIVVEPTQPVSIPGQPQR